MVAGAVKHRVASKGGIVGGKRVANFTSFSYFWRTKFLTARKMIGV